MSHAIPDDVSCPQCAIVLQDIAVLGRGDAPASVREDAVAADCMVSRWDAGSFVVSGAVGGGELLVYDSTGVFTRTIGSRGAGPGEFGAEVRVATSAADSLYALDLTHVRVTVFAPTGDYVRSFRAPDRVTDMALMRDGRFLFSVRPIAFGGSTLVLTAPDGARMSSFGQSTLRQFELDSHIVANANGHGFWTASRLRYELQFWRTPTAPTRRLVREAEWFPAQESFPLGVPFERPPPPALKQVRAEGAERLWIYVVVPSEAWEPGMSMEPYLEWARKTFDTIVEVVDLVDGTVVARARHDGMLGVVCDENLIYTVDYDPEGDTQVTVWEPRLEGLQ